MRQIKVYQEKLQKRSKNKSTKRELVRVAAYSGGILKIKLNNLVIICQRGVEYFIKISFILRKSKEHAREV